MQALILAAGMGKRLKSLTAENTKCMITVNGVTLIERMLSILDRKDLSRIILVTGYQGQKLRTFVSGLALHTPIIFLENPVYDKTNNIYSLSLASDYLCEEDTLLLESDLIFEEAVIDMLLDDERETLTLVDKYENWMDGTCTILNDNDTIKDFIPGKYLNFSETDHYYKTVNVYKFSRHFSKYTYIPFLMAYAKAMGNNEYYESVIKLITLLETKEIRAKRLHGQRWYEIDDIQDLDIAESMFANSAKKYDIISKRYGGYWRYPRLLDFCYLVNPFFPTRRMEEEMIANFSVLMSQYPSGMGVNSLLAAKNFGVSQSHIAVGNGAAELIKSLMEQFAFERVGFIRPTFEEYPNRFYKEAVFFHATSPDFCYSARNIMDFFEEREMDALVLINPDNPSGNYIDIESLKDMILWAKRKDVVLIVDESFVDFVDAEDCETREFSLIREEILAIYDKLYVIKSISKSYGVPGFRLGVVASANEQGIQKIKEDVSIWNINSFGEFFMQIYEKYQSDYEASLIRIRNARREMFQGLKALSAVCPIPSQANYIMCRLERGSGSWLAQELLARYDILIKDLTAKIKDGREYIRLAVRTKEENKKLLSAMAEIYGES